MTIRFRLPALLILSAAIAALVNNTVAARAPAVSPHSPEEAVTQFTVSDGLEVSLFAAEPMVRNPTDIDVDERGRVWVCEGVNYRSSFQRWGVLQPAGDRIIVLEDTNGDGKADKATVFYQDPSINAALGICVLGNRVIISDSPNVFVLTDTDGDGKADKRELLFTGIGGVDHDHGVHAFVFGPDGKLYFNMGNESKQLRYPVTREVPLHGPIQNAPSKPVIDLEGNEVNNKGKPYRMGMAFRCNLDGSDVETLAWNFRNNYELAVDSFGTVWQSDNDDDGNRGVRVNYVMEHGNFGYADEMTGASWGAAWEKARAKGAPEDSKVFHEWHHYDPGVVPNLLQTGGGSPTGILVYEGNLLPEVFKNQLIHCDAGPRVVRAYPVRAEGAGYRAEIKDMLTTKDTWFRPSDVCAAPDGSICIADWNDAGVGGHNMADQNVETMTGRIYRVVPKGHKAAAPRLDLSTAAGCVRALQSPNQATRYLVWTAVHAMGSKAEPELLKLWKGSEARMRARALQLLARMDAGADRYVTEALKDRDPDIRISGLRIARALKLDLVPRVNLLVKDASPQVRRECAIALRHSQSSEAPRLWEKLAMQYAGDDRWYLEALGIGADAQWDAFFDAWRNAVGGKWNAAVNRDIVWRSRSKETPTLLAALIKDAATSAPDRDRYFRSFDFINGPEKQAALVELLSASPAAVVFEALSRLKGTDLDSIPAAKSAVVNLLDQNRGTPRFIEIVRDFKIKGQEPGLLEIALKNSGVSVGADAMRLIVNSGQQDILMTSLSGTSTAAAIEALGNTGEKSVVPLLAPMVTELTRDVAIRKQAVRALAKVHAGAMELLGLAEAGKLPADLRLTTSTALNYANWPDVKDRAAKDLPPPEGQDSKPLLPISLLVRTPGDPVNGAAVYRRDAVGCIKCHQVNGEGTEFGPNLSEIGGKLGKDALYEAILDPSAGISFGYEGWQITLKDGNEASGLLVNETPDELAIKTVGGIVTRYRKSEITNRTKHKVSLMPEGLQKTMTAQELADLVEYLSTFKKSAAK
jgi:putative membrane-bound dehydrogenase-like protein